VIEPVHIPILTEAILAELDLGPGDACIDATVNGGGHTEAFLAATAPSGRVLGIDRDSGVIEVASARHAAAIAAGRLVLAHGNFRDIGAIAQAHGFAHVRAVLFDVGLSSYHLDHSQRGFRFSTSEPLDMRFDATDLSRPTAADLLRDLSLEELRRIFQDYGEERFGHRIAVGVVRAREERPIATTDRLLDVITTALPRNVRWRAARSAARIFQALRIAVNEELAAIEAALPQAFELLAPSGRLAVLAFHSLEDRIVKRTFLDFRHRGLASVRTKRPLRADEDEVAANSRAASAKLRVCERLPHAIEEA